MKVDFLLAILCMCLFMFMRIPYRGLVVYCSGKGNTYHDKGDKNVHLLTTGCM